MLDISLPPSAGLRQKQGSATESPPISNPEQWKPWGSDKQSMPSIQNFFPGPWLLSQLSNALSTHSKLNPIGARTQWCRFNDLQQPAVGATASTCHIWLTESSPVRIKHRTAWFRACWSVVQAENALRGQSATQQFGCGLGCREHYSLALNTCLHTPKAINIVPGLYLPGLDYIST